MTDQPTTARVTENGKSAYAVTIDVSGHQICGDEPVSFGGGNAGPAPYDLLLAALGECTAITVRWYAKQKGWPLERVEVNLSHRKEESDGKKNDVFEKEILLFGDALTDEQRQKLRDVAAKCPVHRTLQSAPVIHTR